jgi:hypothetical protein
LKDFLGVGHRRPRQISKIVDHHSKIGYMSERQFADYKWMEKNITSAEKVTESNIRVAKMIYPDRRIGKEQHTLSGRPSARRSLCVRLGATQSGQPASGFNLDIRFQRFANDGRLLLNARILLRSGEKFVIYRNGGFHR